MLRWNSINVGVRLGGGGIGKLGVDYTGRGGGGLLFGKGCGRDVLKKRGQFSDFSKMKKNWNFDFPER